MDRDGNAPGPPGPPWWSEGQGGPQPPTTPSPRPTPWGQELKGLGPEDICMVPPSMAGQGAASWFRAERDGGRQARREGGGT